MFKFRNVKTMIGWATLSTVILFLISFCLNEYAQIIIQIITISYLMYFILHLIFKEEKKEIKKIQGKKDRTKNFTGSTYKKIFHKKECRFADSIKDEYFVEHDDEKFFKKQDYKACKLCMGKNVDKTNLKKKK